MFLILAKGGIDKSMLFSRYHTDFEQIEKLASGGFGSVYRARNIVDDNEYAIKKIYFKNSTPEFCEKVLRETRVFSSLNHENIVNYHSSWLEFDVVSPNDGKNKKNPHNAAAAAAGTNQLGRQLSGRKNSYMSKSTFQIGNS